MYRSSSMSRLRAAVVLLYILSTAPLGCREIPPLQSQGDAGPDGAAELEGGAAGTGTDAAVTPGSCSGVACYTPPPNECAGQSTLLVHSPVGYCADGECHYATREEPCETGGCTDGICTDNPCQGVSCIQPPDNMCADTDELLLYSSRGYCAEVNDLPECRYAFSSFDCTRRCQDGACVGEPWVGAECNTPPARFCESDTLLVWHTGGRLVDGRCEYTKKVIECEEGCADGNCIDELLCPHITCDTPPAAYCVGDSLRVFEGRGVCDEENNGFCDYLSRDLKCDNGCEAGQCIDQRCVGVTCDDTPVPTCLDDSTLRVWDGTAGCDEATGACRYGTADIDCENGCANGACTGDPCTGVVCTSQPSSHCLDPSTLRSYQGQGSCQVDDNGEPFCSYSYDDITCDNGCANGRCQGDPCAGVVCDSPSANYCIDDSLRTYESTGTCSAGFCTYDYSDIPCTYGCSGGSCNSTTYTVGGTVSGLASGNSVVLRNNGGDGKTVSANGSYTFDTALADNSSYDVTVYTQPTVPNQTCVVSNGSGTLSGGNVTNVNVSCTTDTYTVGGTVSGLASGNSVVLRNNGGDDKTVSANGSYTFGTALSDGSSYDVTVYTQPTTPNQTCVVSNGSGTISGGNVTNVNVSCTTDTYTVGGTVSGLASGNSVVLQNDGGDDETVSGNGSYTFDTALSDGSSYSVTVYQQPTSPDQTCTVSNGSGTLSGGNVTNVNVSCTTDTYTVGGTVSGLASGNSVVLRNNGGDDETVSANGSYTFDTALADGSSYSVTVYQQPTSPEQSCAVSNGSGTISGKSVTDVTVTCSEVDCLGQPDFTPCSVVTSPDRSYDICVNEQCVSPGCGDESCNAPGPHFPLADTNQRLCYDISSTITCPSPGQSFCGQDAQYGWDLTHASTERFSRDTSVANQPVVADNVTGLVWQGCAIGLSGDDCATDSPTGLSWLSALAECENLTWGGHTDWRLPDEYELHSIVDLGTDGFPIDTTAFPNTPGDRFWSSSSRAGYPSYAWYVDFGGGLVSSGNKSNTVRFHVRCVRGGSTPRPARFTRNTSVANQPVVADNATGLVWQGCAIGRSGDNCATGSPTTFTWQTALAECENLSWGGATHWRLPNRKELHSIVDNRVPELPIDTAAFPNTPSDSFWWSSSSAGGSAWCVYLYAGAVNSCAKVNSWNVRCVRDGP